MEALGRFPKARTWFNLGDRDLGTHLYRTDRLRAGATLGEVTAEIAEAWGLACRLLPVSNDPVRTRVTVVDEGEISFQEYFVRRHHDVAATAVRFEGADAARPGPGVLEAVAAADRVLIAPSNPLVSIDPVLAVPGVREAVAARRSDVVAVSPIVAGAALKGPADRLLVELGHESSVVGVARLYAPLASVLVIDSADARARRRRRGRGPALRGRPHDHDRTTRGRRARPRGAGGLARCAWTSSRSRACPRCARAMTSPASSPRPPRTCTRATSSSSPRRSCPRPRARWSASTATTGAPTRRSSRRSPSASCGDGATSSSARPGTASCARTPGWTSPTWTRAGPRCSPRTATARPGASATASGPASASRWPSSSRTPSGARGARGSPTSPSAARASGPSSTSGAPRTARAASCR